MIRHYKTCKADRTQSDIIDAFIKARGLKNFMLKKLVVLLAVFTLASPLVHAQTTLPDRSPQQYLKGKTLKLGDVIPPGYREVARAQGDLDKDGIDDLALILASEKDDAQPVMLLRGVGAGQFKFWKAGAAHFQKSNVNFMEPGGVGEFKIDNGVLTIASATAMSAGGWQAGGCTQKWRLEKAGFRLIGLTLVDLRRTCACGTVTDTNFLTGATLQTSDSGKRTANRRRGKRLPKRNIRRASSHGTASATTLSVMRRTEPDC